MLTFSTMPYLDISLFRSIPLPHSTRLPKSFSPRFRSPTRLGSQSRFRSIPLPHSTRLPKSVPLDSAPPHRVESAPQHKVESAPQLDSTLQLKVSAPPNCSVPLAEPNVVLCYNLVSRQLVTCQSPMLCLHISLVRICLSADHCPNQTALLGTRKVVRSSQ